MQNETVRELVKERAITISTHIHVHIHIHMYGINCYEF